LLDIVIVLRGLLNQSDEALAELKQVFQHGETAFP
jgi:hypothetical protein